MLRDLNCSIKSNKLTIFFQAGYLKPVRKGFSDKHCNGSALKEPETQTCSVQASITWSFSGDLLKGETNEPNLNFFHFILVGCETGRCNHANIDKVAMN